MVKGLTDNNKAAIKKAAGSFGAGIVPLQMVIIHMPHCKQCREAWKQIQLCIAEDIKLNGLEYYRKQNELIDLFFRHGESVGQV